MLSSYIKSLLSIGICAFICENIITNKRLSAGMNLITSLCIFIVIISPVLTDTFKNNINEILNMHRFESTTQSTEITFKSLIEDETEKELSEEILKKFGIHTSNVIIDLNEVNNEITIESINILLEHSHASYKSSIYEYLIEIFGNDTKITVVEKTE